jgi:membrane protease YdiL (CAAX protease family)
LTYNENTPARRIRFVDLLIFAAALVAGLAATLYGLVELLGEERLALAMPESGPSTDPVATLVALGASFGAVLPAVGLAVARHGSWAPALLGFNRSGGRWLWLLPIITVVLSFAGDDLLLWLAYQVLGEEQEPTIVALMVSLATTPLMTLATILVAGVLGPVAEELIFRGLIYGYVEGRFGSIAALIVSSLLFAAAHVEPAHVAVVLPMGFLLGWSRMHTGSMWPALAAHIANNTAATLAVYLFA